MSIFTLKKSATTKVVSVLVGSAMALTLVFGGAVAPAQAQTMEELTAQINSLLSTIAALQAQLLSMSGGTTQATGVSYNFTTNLSKGDSGVQVMNLQKVLNMSSDTQAAVSGVGSPGNETEYFGSLTKAAVIKFQNKYASEILAPVGLSAGTGYVGPSTRAKLNTMGGAVVTTPGTTPVVVVTPAGTGLTVSAGYQPAATLAPEKAARVPFTKVVLTASNDGDIVVNSILIERTGLAQDGAFAGIVLLDEDGIQIGIAKTLNSLHQAKVGEDFTVKAGTSKTITIAANMHTSSMSTYTGQVGSLTVVGVNTSAAVNGTLPIVGTSHTMNSSLTIGTATADRGIDDPNTSATKEVGVSDYTFAAIKVTAGSAEKIRVHSLRWNQSGSVSSSDLENLKTYVDGIAYDVIVSSDGKYYTASFGSGLVIDKGLSKQISIKGDIVGGSGRNIVFDIYKDTDLYVTGETYGYGITPAEGSAGSVSTSGSAFLTTTPWYDNAHVTVSDGTLTVAKATSVSAQNIAEVVENQILGGFDVEVKGEAISVASLVFNGTISAGAGVGTSIDNVTLVDENGSVVAGPVDAEGASTAATVTFTDTVTFPIGIGTYTLKGQLASTFVNDQTIVFNTDPDDDWTTVTGQTTGNSITPAPTSAVTSNTMTMKAGTVSISVSDNPVAQNVVAGAQGFVFANYQFDATASGEDVRFTSLILELTAATSPEYLTGCQLWDGDTALNTGSNKKDVASTDTSVDITFTLDSGGVTIPKGTVKTLALTCNVSASATSETFLWDMTDATDQTGTGLNSGTTITVTDTTGTGQLMSATSYGGLTVAEQTGTYLIAAAGTTDVTLGSLKFTGTNEEITLKKLSLQLTSASSSPSDMTQVTLWDGTTQVGTAVFTSTDYATSTLTGSFVIPKDGTKIMTLKADLAEIGTSKIGTQGALLKVNYNGGDLDGTQGVGDQSGTTISSTSATSSTFDGVRVFKAHPEFAKISLSDSLTSGTTILYKFSVTANDADGSSEGIGLYKFTLNLATSSDNAATGSTTVTAAKVYAYSDSSFSNTIDSSADGTAYTNGQIVDEVSNLAGTTTGADNELVLNSPIQIPAGETYYFKVIGTTSIVSGTGTDANNWVKAYITGDSAYHVGSANLMDAAATVDDESGGNDAFVWSPYATTTSAILHADWTNGYKISGLPSDGMDAETINQ
ncbi:MAG: peptidoglycan-binding protein [Candidatus Pacebacteria bacterium]|nr:peptidoglycan-binding protein [Candidatus Paceibacterota bacterium]